MLFRLYQCCTNRVYTSILVIGDGCSVRVHSDFKVFIGDILRYFVNKYVMNESSFCDFRNCNRHSYVTVILRVFLTGDKM